MEEYLLKFDGAEGGVVVTMKRRLQGISSDLAHIVKTNIDQREMIVRAKNRQILLDMLKNYDGRYKLELVPQPEEKAHPSCGPSASLRDTKYLSRTLQDAQTTVAKLEERVEDLKMGTEIRELELKDLREQLEKSKQKYSGGIESIAFEYLQRQVPIFFEACSVIEKHQSQGDLEAVLRFIGKSFIEYVNSVLEKEGLATYPSELALKKDLDAAAIPFEGIPEHKKLIGQYAEAKDVLGFLDRAHQVSNIPKSILDEVVAKCREREPELQKTVAAFESAQKTHQKKQALHKRFNDLQIEYELTKTCAEDIKKACTNVRLSYVLVQGHTSSQLTLPFPPEYQGLWLSQKLKEHAWEALGGKKGAASVVVMPFTQLPVPLAMTHEDVIANLKRTFDNYDFAKFGLGIEVISVYRTPVLRKDTVA